MYSFNPTFTTNMLRSLSRGHFVYAVWGVVKKDLCDIESDVEVETKEVIGLLHDVYTQSKDHSDSPPFNLELAGEWIINFSSLSALTWLRVYTRDRIRVLSSKGAEVPLRKSFLKYLDSHKTKE